MKSMKICLATSPSFGLSEEDQIRLFAEIGFDGFFTGWAGDLSHYRALADETGMYYQSVHAPFGGAGVIWEEGEEGENAAEELLRCVRDTAAVGVPLVIVHPYKGFHKEEPTELGLSRFERVVREAERLGVSVAFENVEGEAYLNALMDQFADCPTVGFCWDSGHELCYNRGKDMLGIYGDRLRGTHINDNLGVSDPNGKITWHDDLHLLPFDGNQNWQGVAERLKKSRPIGELTLELTRKSKPNRHDNDRYMEMKIEDYLADCYARAVRIAQML